MNTPTWLKPLHLELVFANRNQAYGAYDLRMQYEKNMAKGMAFGFLFFFSVFGSVLYIMTHKTLDTVTPIKEVFQIVELSNFKKTDPVPITKAEAPKNIPLKSQIKYVAPKVVTDITPVQTTDVPTQENLANVEIGLTDHVSEDPGSVGQTLPEETGTTTQEVVSEAPVAIYAVEKKPEFPGGEKAMYEYLNSHLKFPELAKSNGISGTVVVQFVVSPSGKIENVIILKSPSSLFNKMAQGVVEAMPKWSPGIMNGKAVSVYFTLPLRFDLR